jgi:hypothetical protein
MQSAFSRIWQFFAVEGHPRAVQSGTCAYRSQDSACAAGCLIPDGIIACEDNHEILDVVVEKNSIVGKLLPRRIRRRLFTLQHLHDTARNEKEFVYRLHEFAKARHLKIPRKSIYDVV